MENFIERLQCYMSHKDINDNQMTIAAGLSVGLLGKAKSGGKGLSSSSIEKILLAYDDINPDWLLTGRGPMLKTKGTPNASPTGDESLSSPKDTNKVLNKQEKEARKSPKGIPLIPLEAVAGFPAADSEGVYLEDCERYTIPEFEAKGANFLIRVSGDSMFPLYNNGDIIACRKISDILFFQWGSIYVLDTSQGALVKRVEEAEDDAESILCISENPRFKPFHLPKSDIRSLSTIIGLVRLV
ncbi:hypothetical protein C7120_01585 [Prevotella sp. oral taxon 376]|nr:hypothetical protein C7120_01585 [Prevotella sp. oral taxon 376]